MNGDFETGRLLYDVDTGDLRGDADDAGNLITGGEGKRVVTGALCLLFDSNNYLVIVAPSVDKFLKLLSKF